ncbi:isoaspartyl peptidase/L-asparaginase family protein [Pontibacter harenae]|uniref:isoaspartyl peptidase/L-asparaginase family protein n=1 Tax=Pontibacter harenae TaxID=2894083 RepID=UPI001E5A1182|nr:isoaspartyl peptidase/L-asparaginase [Pontibacter harenae]MCC9168549.1 isoaspartyl peptidase/L-asparaginase [Pontibacter harenae]
MKKFSIAIHGGAENLRPEDVSKEKEEQYRRGLEEALQAGWEILNKNGSAIDAVVAATKCLENNPLYNAGVGSSINRKGEIEFNASLMDGKTLNAGAVGCVRFVKNPIDLARCIMDKCEHSFLAGAGAEEFAIKHQLPLMEHRYFFSKEKEDQWLELRNNNKLSNHDTVGAVALDQEGNLAAATSTGGLTYQLKGRISDGPMLGCGTLAINDVCAVACTGDGEVIMRGILAHEVYAFSFLTKFKSFTTFFPLSN